MTAPLTAQSPAGPVVRIAGVNVGKVKKVVFDVAPHLSEEDTKALHEEAHRALAAHAAGVNLTVVAADRDPSAVGFALAVTQGHQSDKLGGELQGGQALEQLRGNIAVRTQENVI